MTQIVSKSLRNKFIEKAPVVSNNVNYAAIKNKMLMREYIEKKLYFDDGYYSLKKLENFLPIGKLEKPLNFREMRGMGDYAVELNNKYPKSTWLTCSELLRPYFGFALGNYIKSIHMKNNSSSNIKIIEIGCGMGGAIDSILEYLKNFSIKDYKEIEYIGLEINEIMCDSTKSLLNSKHPELFKKNQITILNKSLYEYDFESDPITDGCFVLAFNFIDSIGHDRIKLKKDFFKNFNGELVSNYQEGINNQNSLPQLKKFIYEYIHRNNELIQESHVYVDKENKFLEEYEPLNDDLIREMIFYLLLKDQEIDSIMGQNFINLERSRNKYNEDWFVKFLRKLYNFSYNQNTIWFPTESIRFFKYLFKNFPNHKLVLLDFDFIPSKMFNCDYKGKNCPAVYSIIENSLDSITHNSIFDSYSTVKKPVNIYFPVDFELLQIMYKIITGKLATMNKFKYFMEGYSMSEWCESRNGFNPLIHTHHNMSFLLTI